MAKLTASDAEEYARFGGAVALDGGLLIVGADGDDYVWENAGAAYVYRLEGVDWVEEAKLTAADPGDGDGFGTSVDLTGELAIAGASGSDGAVDDAGAAYVYRRESQTWVQEAKLVAPDPTENRRFGRSVAIYGDLAAVGAPYDNDAGSKAGAVYVFRREGTSWVLEDKLTPSDGSGWMGQSVALTASRVLAGASHDDDNGVNSGAAYVFRREGQTWTQEAKLLPSDGSGYDYFGGSVDLDMNLAVVGARNADGAEHGSGAAYVFRREGESWVEEDKLAASDGAEDDGFDSVAVEGDIVLVGAHYQEPGEHYNLGALYVFDYDGISWTEQLKLVPTDGAPNDEFGTAVSLDGGLALVGALHADTPAGSTGAAYLMQVTALDTDCNGNGLNDACEPDCDQNGIPDECEPQDDCNDNGVLDVCDLFFNVSFDCNGNGVPDECDIAEGTSEDCNYDAIPDECQPDEDCNSNGVKDICDIGAGTSADCNWNLVPDECDIAGGTSQDVDENGIPDECAPQPFPEDSLGVSCTQDDECLNESTCIQGVCYVPKNRYVSFVPLTEGVPTAFKVTSPSCPDMERWVGEPGAADDCDTPDFCAEVCRLDEAPYFSSEWPALVHVGDEEVHPGAVYAIRATYDGINFSAPLRLPTTRVCGDVVGRFVGGTWEPPNGLVNIDDERAFVQAFRQDPAAAPMTWMNLAGDIPYGRITHNDEAQIGVTFRYNDSYMYSTSCSCLSDGDCPEGVFCNGAEVCAPSLDGYICYPGPEPCPSQVCVEDDEMCAPCQSDEDCDDGLWCNGPESCMGGFCGVGLFPCGDQGCNELADACAGPGEGPTLALVPVGVPGGNATYDGNHVFLQEGGFDVILELRLSDWDSDQDGDPLLRTYQGTIDSRGYLGGNCLPHNPGVDLTPLALSYYGEWTNIDSSRQDFVFFALVPLAHLSCVTQDYKFATTTLGGPRADDGQEYYAGHLTLQVPVDAGGTYTISFDPHDDFTFLGDDTGARIPGLTIIPARITLPSDCNNNGVPDVDDIAAGTSEDCNQNWLPDECDIFRGISTDCNANSIPDDCEPYEDCNNNGVQDICDIAGGTSGDCNGNGNWIPDECEPDCNANGAADSCDIAEGTSQDCQPNGVPDECDLAEGTSHDYDDNGTLDDCERTNRYVFFPPDNSGPPIAYEVEMSQSLYFPDSTGVIGWVGEPFEPSYDPAVWIARLVDTPFYTEAWPAIVYVGDCAIVPVATYLIRGTVDGETFTDPFEVSTIAQPIPKKWADCVGAFDGTKWSGANRIVNMDDIMAGVQKFQQLDTAPLLTWLDIDPEVPNAVFSFTDIFWIVQGFKGEPYPFSAPADCP